MKKTLIVLPVLAALTLTGCAPQALEFEAAPATMPAVESANTTEQSQVWADKQIDTWLSANGARSIDALGGPTFYVDSWESPSEGVLVVHTKDGSYTKADLGMVARSILHGTTEPEKITAINEYGKIEATYERID